jgi:histidyl-tRNA synthetase
MYKAAKGTQDLVGDEYRLIHDVIKAATREFEAAGAVPLETPVFERADVLLGKYGEAADTKLVYHIDENGGEPLALRYDLTVPFLRYIKENGIKQMRRYSVGKVYRRDQPNINAGRYREFIQADFDIYGEVQEGMLAEATVLNAVCRVLDQIGLFYTIQINDVRNLRAILQDRLGLGVGWRACCPIIDKLDKRSFTSLQEEFTAAGLTAAQIAELEQLLQEPAPICAETAADYATLCEAADILGFKKRLKFTSSLARGLDYYTGFIWEFKFIGHASSVCAGGRYDGLLGAPAVGISIGVSRLARTLAAPASAWKEVYYVTGLGEVTVADKLRVVAALQKKGHAVTYSLAAKDKKLGKVLTECALSWIRYVVIVGENEIATGSYSVKDLQDKVQIELKL